MAKKIRKQTISLSSYLDKVRDEEISDNQDVQRLSGAWDLNMMNELIVTVLTDDYIPPVIIGEEELGNGLTQQYIVDGLQRSSTLVKFRYGNYRITSSVENSVITYQKKADDGQGSSKHKDKGPVWELMEFDLKGKTYEELPKELKKAFCDYQIETIIHQNCTMQMISKLVRRYNNHKAMNAAQTAFTYLDIHARKIRNLTGHSFFKDNGHFTEKEKINGVYERVICESVMAIHHLENWQKQGKRMGKYLNEHATPAEFDALEGCLDRLVAVIEETNQDLFTSRDAFIWITLFHRFTELNLCDGRFNDFLTAFKAELHGRQVPGGDRMESFDEVNANRATKDKQVIIRKLKVLETLMGQYFQIQSSRRAEASGDGTALAFLKETVSEGITEQDLEFYEEVLEDLTLNVDNRSALLHQENHVSLLALVAYACQSDIDLDDWIVGWFQEHHAYIRNQRGNYMDMRSSLDQTGANAAC